MTKKFNPPPDKHAEKTTDRVRHDLKPDGELGKGLKESFLASDTPSAPSHRKRNQPRNSYPRKASRDP
jgi:hypothetical protein